MSSPTLVSSGPCSIPEACHGVPALEGMVPSYDSLGACAGFHMTAAVASVPTLGLPFAVSLLGWAGGLIALVAGGLVTLFTSLLIAGLLEFGGKRHIRYRDLAQAIFGKPPSPC